MIGRSTIAKAVRKGASMALSITASGLTLAALFVVGVVLRDIWDEATAAGQISAAIITGSGIIAVAVHFSAGRVQNRVVLASDHIEGLELREGTGPVYVVAPAAKTVHTRVVQAETGGGAA